MNKRSITFDDQLMAEIQVPRSHFLGAILVLAGVAIATFGVVVGAWAGYYYLTREDIHELALRETVLTLHEGLRQEDWDRALNACAESPAGRALLSAHELALGLPPESPGVLDARQMDRVRSLQHIRNALTEHGIDWAVARPVAFGGVLASLEHGADLAAPLEVMWGVVYVESGSQHYSIELTLWKCTDAYVVVDLWRAGPVEEGGSDLAALTAALIERHSREPEQSNIEIDVTSQRDVFVAFDYMT